MRSSLLICSLLLISVTVTMAQDTGAAGQGDTGPSQSAPVQTLPVPQIPADQNTIRSNPYGDLLRGAEQRQGQERGPAETALPQEQTQFQLYVAQSLGSILPIYGTSFFTRVPSTFAPLQNVPVPADYILGPGDEVVVRAWGQVDVDYRDTIDRNGNIYLPKVGALHVAGLPYDQLHSYVSTAVSRVFRNFQLNTSLGALRSIQVFVVGYAQRPGGYTVGSMSTLVNAIFTAGGPAPNGSMRHVLLKRGGKLVTDFDLYDLLLRGDKSGDRQLLPGDVIYFAPVGPQVAFAGSVNEPAIYELRDKTTMGELLELAGGLSPIAVGTRANIERIDNNRVRSVAQFVLQGDGLKRELEDGDIISISPVSARFGNAVTLRGNVAAPGRHPWHEGMRVKDLIPNLYTLVTEKYWLSQNEITRTAQWGKTLVDQNCQPGSPYAGTAACLANPSNPMFSPLTGQPLPTGPGQRGFPQPYGATGQFPMTSGPYGPGGQYSPNAPYNQQQPTAGYGPSGGYGPYVPYYPQYQGQPFNTPGLATSNTTTATLAGAQQLTSAAQVALKAEISRVAPEINWDYALIERLNMEDLTTHLIPFNLRRALTQPDSEDNFLLKPGDVVTIFSQEDMRVPAAEQSKYVYLEGEIKTPGVYKAEPGETLRQLVARVGGLTNDAYLFGAEFTRDSAQKEQQLRLDQAARQFEQEIERNAAQQATTNIANASGSQEQADFQANLSSQRQLVDRLKEVKADGRIVLGVAPGDNEVSAIPNIALEDGDRFVVPSRPSFVNVVGAVYTPSSFIFRRNGRTRDYLREAGGGTRVADPKRLFVVRADGSVVARTSGAFSGSLMGARLMPGDTIVVPEQLNKPGFMRGLKDWSYILGQIGLAAAAINVLK